MAGADVRLPDIKASVKVDTKDVDASLTRVSSSTRSAGKGFDGLQSTAKGAIDNMSSSLTSKLGPASGAADAALSKLSTTGSLMGPAIAGGAAIAGIAVAQFALDGAQAFVGLAGEIRNFQRASGASAEDSSRFVAVLDDLGVSSEVGSKAIFKLGREIGEGGKKLAEYGIEVARANDGTASTTETLLNLADAYVKTNDPGRRAALVMDTLGKAGQSLVPILEQGRAGLAAFFEGAEGGRQIFSQADLDKARAYELQIDELQDTIRGLKLEAGESLLPFLTGLANATTKTVSFADAVKDKVGGAIATVGRVAAGAFSGGASEGILAGLRKLTGGSDSAKKSTKELAEEMKASAAASEEDARAKQAQAVALDKVLTATLATLSSQIGYEQSVNTLKDNINDLDDRTQDYSKAVAENGANSKEAEAANRALRDAHLGIEQSAVAAASAAVRLASDTAEAGGKALTAQEKTNIFRDALVELANQADGPSKQAILNLADQILGMPDRTVTVDVDTSSALAKIASLERRLASVSSGADSTAGPQQFARGLDVGPVKGPPGAAVPIIAHAGEWVVTPNQLADLRNSPAAVAAPASSDASSAAPPPMVHTTIVVDRKVLAESTTRGQYEARRR